MNLKALGIAFRWLRAHWKIPVTAAAFVVANALRRRHQTQLQEPSDNLNAIDEKLRQSKATIDANADAARAQAEQAYTDKLARLNEEQRAQAEELKDDPEALAAFLSGIGDAGE